MQDLLLFLKTERKEELVKEQGGRRLNVCGVLRIPGISRSEYLRFKKKIPSGREKRKQVLKKRIITVYGKSFQNYGAPKITERLQKEGAKIAKKPQGTI